VVEPEQKASDPVEIFANEVLIARGKVVITSGDKIGVTLTELVKLIYNQGDCFGFPLEDRAAIF